MDRLNSKQGRGKLYRDLQARSLPALVPTDHLPPSPCVYLGEVKGYRDVPCTIRFSAVDGYGDLADELLSRIADADLGSVEIAGTARPVMRYSLMLLPVGQSGAVKPVLRVESKTDVLAAEDFSDYAHFGGSDPVRKGRQIGVIWGPLEDGQNFVDIDAGPLAAAAYDEKGDSLVCLNCEIECDTSEFPTYENSRFARAAANHSWLLPFDDRARAYLSEELRSDQRARYCRYCWDTVAALQDNHRSPIGGLTVFGSHTMAAAFERSLLLEEPPEARLDRLLDKSAQVLVDKLNEELGIVTLHREKRLNDILREYQVDDRKL
jgi:hypothetical protein